MPKYRVLLYGTDPEQKVTKLLAELVPEAFIVGYVGDICPISENNITCLGTFEDVTKVAKEQKVSLILLLPDSPLDDKLSHKLLNARLEARLNVETIGSLIEQLTASLPVEHIRDSWLLLEDGFSLNLRRRTRQFKRCVDFMGAFVLLIITFPLMFFVAVAVRLDSPGAVIYKQKRVGLMSKEFVLLKFRSMRVDAEKDGAVWAKKNDNRVTAVGKFIRKVRLDELPQLINIIKGDMSFIGPRPERMEFIKELNQKIPYYYIRSTVKPGLTGWAQVNYPYGASVEDAKIKLEYDLYYIKNMSLLLDLKIILKTIGVIIFPVGAR